MADEPKPAEDGGVLGNLPRTRPGHRSEKRAAGRPAEAAGAAARKAEAGDGPAARTARPTQRKPTGTRARRPAAPASEQPSESASGGILEGALHGAGRIAGAGARVAEGLARELVRRLPRP
jgi:hypothetical protein